MTASFIVPLQSFGSSASLVESVPRLRRKCALSYLPLSHVAGLAVDDAGQIVIGALTKSNSCVFFARPYDLKVGAMKDRRALPGLPCSLVFPSLIWEKMSDRIRAISAVSTCLKAVSTWAKAKALEHARNITLVCSGVVPGMHCLAMKIMNAVEGAVGLDKCKYALTGTAPIRDDTLEYFESLGIYINEVYGMSESARCVTMSTARRACGVYTVGSFLGAR